MLALILLAIFIVPLSVACLVTSNGRAFLGYTALLFSGIYMAFYTVHLTGIFPGY